VTWLYLLFAFVAGAMIPFQAGANAQLAHWVNSPIRAALASFVVGMIALVVIAAFVFRPYPWRTGSEAPLGGCGSAGCWARSTSSARS